MWQHWHYFLLGNITGCYKNREYALFNRFNLILQRNNHICRINKVQY